MHSVCVDIRDAANNKVNLEKYTDSDRPAITGNGQCWAATSTSKTACV